MKYDWILGTILALCLIGMTMIATERPSESCKMYSEMFNETKKGINGYYVPEHYKTLNTEFYCIWTSNRSPEEITKTENHEFAHVLVDKNFYHYCIEHYEGLWDISK